MKILRKKVKILDEIKEQVELIADEGYVITEKNPKEEQERIYSPHLFLSFSDSVDNYVEILESDILDKGEIVSQEEILKDGEYS